MTTAPTIDKGALATKSLLSLEQEAKSRLIGRGKHGGVFYPPLTHGPLRCLEEKDSLSSPLFVVDPTYSHDSRYVMKIMTLKDARREQQVSRILQRYDPSQSWFTFLIPDHEYTLHPDQYRLMWDWSIVKNSNSPANLHELQKQNYAESSVVTTTTALSTAMSELKMSYKHTSQLQAASTSTESTAICYGFISCYSGRPYTERLSKLKKCTKWIRIVKDALHLFKGLFFLHETVQVVHRDIKPCNIGYLETPSSSGKPKFLDFGLGMSVRPNQSLHDICQEMGNMRFQIWSIDINTKCNIMRTPKRFYKWIEHEEVRRWCLWFDHCRVTSKTEDEDEWYEEYIHNCIEFWNLVDSICQHTNDNNHNKPDASAAPSISMDEQSKLRFVITIITMLKQNDVISLGIMFLDFLYQTYLPYHKKKRNHLPQRLLLAKWIQNVAIPMIHPNFKTRIKLDEAIRHTQQIIEEYEANEKLETIKSKKTTITTVSKAPTSIGMSSSSSHTNADVATTMTTTTSSQPILVSTTTTTIAAALEERSSLSIRSTTSNSVLSSHSVSTATNLQQENDTSICSPDYKRMKNNIGNADSSHSRESSTLNHKTASTTTTLDPTTSFSSRLFAIVPVI